MEYGNGNLGGRDSSGIEVDVLIMGKALML